MPKTPAQPSPHRPERLTRSEWLARALEVIGSEGRGQLSIDELVAAVGVTKGSFYWHFENRDDFVESLLDFWVEEFTAGVTDKVETLGGTAEDRLLALAEIVTRMDRAKYDVAMHAWALREAKVARAVAKAEAIRLDFVRSLFREMGFRGEELEMRTRTFVVFYSFDAGLREQLSERERLALVKRRHAMLVRRE